MMLLQGMWLLIACQVDLQKICSDCQDQLSHAAGSLSRGSHNSLQWIRAACLQTKTKSDSTFDFLNATGEIWAEVGCGVELVEA